jgi:3-deoxy-D-manno-octulosonic-acid transferase
LTFAALFERFDLCLAQSTIHAQRYSELGAPRVSVTGNLKLDVPAPAVNPHMLSSMQASLGNRPIIAACSTHAGEEGMVIDAHRRLRRSFPGLITLIAPRHPERGMDIVALAKAAGLGVVLRSRGHLPDRRTEIYVADTIGELGLLYRLSPMVFIGGSLVRHGGQSPIEAVKIGTAVLHGPHVANFAEIYDALDAQHGAERVTDVNSLTTRFGTWLNDPAACRVACETASKTIEPLGGALARTLAALEPYLMQMRLEHR